MVEPVGYKPVVTPKEPVRVAAPAAPQAASPASPAVAATTTTVAAGTAARLSAQPPVDTDRVERIRKAIAEGKFPILPATVADRLLALKLEWHANDPA